MAATQDFGSDQEFSEDDVVVQTSHGDKRKKAPVAEKDSDEEELERLVFGDSARFRQQLFLGDFLSTGGAQDSSSGALQLADADSDNDELAHVDDADLFALDTAPTASAGRELAQKTLHKAPETTAGDAPAWEDSDDERLTVSLATANRLRKLRVAESEDVINGTEYTKRLRQQFLRLSPMPAWAVESAARPAKRRRRSRDRGSGSDAEMGSGDDDDSNEEEDDISAQPLAEFLRDVNRLTAVSGSSKKQRRLRPGTLDIQRSRDIPNEHRAAVTSLSFHPTQPILLSSSPAGLLRLHRIDAAAHPTPHPEIISVQAKHTDVRRSGFVGARGDKVVFAGRRRCIFGWDLDSGLVQRTTRVLGHKKEHKTMENFRPSPCGRWLAIQASSRKGGGNVDVVDLATMQWIAAARLDSRHGVADFAWWRNGEGLTILGRDGRVGEWSLDAMGFVAVWHDEGCVGAIVVALGGGGRQQQQSGPAAVGGDRWVAVGSNSGIVNLYDRQELFSESTSTTSDGPVAITAKTRPTPTKTFENLVTPITTLAFSPDGQLLAFASQAQRDALRLAHLPSCTVYQNWPTAQTPLGRVTAVAFGAHEPVLAVGNDRGKVRLWDIRA